MKKILTLFIWLVSFNSVIYPVVKASTDNIGIAAIVNNVMISKLQLMQRIKLAILSSNLPNTPQTVKELQQQILDIMINESLQLQIGTQYNFKIPQVMLDNSLNEIETQNNMPSGALHTVLKQNGIPLETMYEHLKANLIWRDYIRERYKDNVQVSEAEVNRALKEFETAKSTKRYDLYELVIDYKANKSGALSSTNRIIGLYNKGTPFPVLAKQFSNSISANTGGHIGWTSQNTLDPETYAHIKDLRPGQISTVLDTGQSLNLYFIKERLEAGQLSQPQTFISFKQILLPLDSQAFEFEVKDTLNRARAMARTIKSCRVVDKLKTSTKMTVQNVDNVPSQNLPPELAKLLANLSSGQASTPVLTEQGVMIFVLCDRVVNNPQEPNAEMIKEQLTERKLQLIADREMRNRRLSAHIDRRI